MKPVGPTVTRVPFAVYAATSRPNAPTEPTASTGSSNVGCSFVASAVTCGHAPSQPRSSFGSNGWHRFETPQTQPFGQAALAPVAGRDVVVGEVAGVGVALVELEPALAAEPGERGEEQQSVRHRKVPAIAKPWWVGKTATRGPPSGGGISHTPAAASAAPPTIRSRLAVFCRPSSAFSSA